MLRCRALDLAPKTHIRALHVQEPHPKSMLTNCATLNLHFMCTPTARGTIFGISGKNLEGSNWFRVDFEHFSLFIALLSYFSSFIWPFCFGLYPLPSYGLPLFPSPPLFMSFRFVSCSLAPQWMPSFIIFCGSQHP